MSLGPFANSYVRCLPVVVEAHQGSQQATILKAPPDSAVYFTSQELQVVIG